MTSTWTLKENSTGELEVTVEGEAWKKAQKKEKEPQKPQKNGKTQGISLCSRIYGSCGRRSGRTGRRLLRMGLGTALYGRS